MDAIKKHMYFVVLIAAVLVVGGVPLLVVALPRAGDTIELMDKRRALDQSIQQLRRDGKNQKQLDAREQYVNDAETAYGRLTAKAVELNAEGWESLTFITKDTGQAIVIFPVDEETHKHHNIRWHFPEVYDEAMKGLLDRLRPATPPTPKEIEDTTRQMETVIRRKLRADTAADEEDLTPLPPGVSADMGGRPGGGVYAPAPMTGGYPAMPMTPLMGEARQWGAGVPGAGAAGGAGRMDARAQAIRALKHRKANDPEHTIYASRYSFAEHYLPRNVEPRLAEMWKAMVNYWLHKYIVAAILDTNSSSFQARTRPGREPVQTITEAAVKRLIGVTMGDMGGGTGGTDTTILYEGEGEPTGWDDLSDRGGRGGRRRPDVERPVEESDTLTGRGGNKKYDVVVFDLEVVMDPAELPAFLRNLTNRRFFTVLAVQMSDLAQTDAGTGATARPGGLLPSPTSTDRFAQADEALYYYGPGPVMRVTLQMEALLFCDWERDMMPVEMLMRLPRGALRDADIKRIKQARGSAAERERTPAGR